MTGALPLALASLLATGSASAAPPPASDAEMTAIFDADQADRFVEDKIDWSRVGPADAARRERTRKLLADGRLHTGADFRHAAFVFQHGMEPNDYLLAHTLAVIAAAKGEPKAVWIAAATLDRYLQRTQRPQVYGTQYMTTNGGPYGQDPYDRTLVSDAIRRELGVPSLADQEKQALDLTAEAAAAKAKR